MQPGKDNVRGAIVREGMMTIGAAAEFLSLSRSMVYALMDKGELPYCKFGSSRRLPRSAVIAFAERCLAGGQA